MSQILSVSRVVSDLARSTQFYIEGLGFSLIDESPCSDAVLRALEADRGAEQAELQLGEELVTLVQFAHSDSSPQETTQSNDLWFQHIALVVSDIELAYEHLKGVYGWEPITENGPQRLPPADGGVRAFKFKGPDGHPFELIWFPAGQGRAKWQNPTRDVLFLGIDHTAVSVSSTSASVNFYRSLDFEIENQTLNEGVKQSLLDAIPGALVDVTALRTTSASGMGIELLRYHPHGRRMMGARPENLVTDWITMPTRGTPPSETTRMVKDPDGHRVILQTI